MGGAICARCGEPTVGGSKTGGGAEACPICGSREGLSTGSIEGIVPIVKLKVMGLYGPTGDVLDEDAFVFVPGTQTILESPVYELNIELDPPNMPRTVVIKDSWGDIVEMSAIDGPEDAAAAVTSAFEFLFPDMWRAIED